MRILMTLSALALALTGCTHLAGTVYDERTRSPLPGAVFTVGRPDGIAVYQQHTSDAKGHFDFSISPTDESHVYVYEPQGGPTTARRIDRTEMSDHMRLYLRPVSPDMMMQ